jgi:hypothetical protein
MGTLFSRPIMAGENAAPDQAALLGDQTVRLITDE